MNRREECELKDRYTDKKEKWGLTQEREKGSVKTDKGLKKDKNGDKKRRQKYKKYYKNTQCFASSLQTKANNTM